MPETPLTRRQASRLAVAVALGAAPVLATAPALLRRMRRDLERDARLRTSTAAWMWADYGAHAALLATTLTTRPTRAPLRAPARAAALTLTAAGTLLVLAGFRRASTGPHS